MVLASAATCRVSQEGVGCLTELGMSTVRICLRPEAGNSLERGRVGREEGGGVLPLSP